MYVEGNTFIDWLLLILHIMIGWGFDYHAYYISSTNMRDESMPGFVGFSMNKHNLL